MPRPLRVLIVEDSPDDAEVLVLRLRRAGCDPAWERVDTAEAMRDRLNRPRPLAEQQQTLVQKLRGRCASHGITGNGVALRRFREAPVRIWRK